MLTLGHAQDAPNYRGEGDDKAAFFVLLFFRFATSDKSIKNYQKLTFSCFYGHDISRMIPLL